MDSGSESQPRNVAGPSPENTSRQQPYILRPSGKASQLARTPNYHKVHDFPSPPSFRHQVSPRQPISLLCQATRASGMGMGMGLEERGATLLPTTITSLE